jgi:hypothetical protein
MPNLDSIQSIYIGRGIMIRSMDVLIETDGLSRLMTSGELEILNYSCFISALWKDS